MKSINTTSISQLQIIQHPSINLLDQAYVDSYKIYLNQQIYDALQNHVRIFKNKFHSLKKATEINSPIALHRFVLEKEDMFLSKLSKQAINMLCDKYGVVILKNFPISFDQDEINIAIFVLGCYLGVPMYNNRDKIYIWPIISRQIDSSKELNGNIRYGNTGAPLSFHTDTTAFAGLLCLQPAQTGGENELISAVAVHNRIYENRKDLLEVLHRSFFIDRRGEQRDGDKPYAEIPIFGMTKSGMLMAHWTKSYTFEAYRKYDVPPLSAAQKEALNYLIDTINQIENKNKVEIKAEAGDFLLCNNNLIFHNRKPFSGDRHLLRIWIHSNQYQSFPHMFGYPCV